MCCSGKVYRGDCTYLVQAMQSPFRFGEEAKTSEFQNCSAKSVV